MEPFPVSSASAFLNSVDKLILNLLLYYQLIFVIVIIGLSKVMRKEENAILINFDEITFVS